MKNININTKKTIEKDDPVKESTVMYYSKKTKKMYNTMVELQKAELALEAEETEQKKAALNRKNEAKKVEDAYHHMTDVRAKATAEVKKANQEYYDLLNAFVKKYGTFHMTYSNTEDVETSLCEALNEVFDVWPFNLF